jgi:subtilisin family serine protease
MTAPKRVRLEVKILFVILFLVLLITGLLCRYCCKRSPAKTIHLGSWNILLQRKETDQTVATIISQFEQQITDSLASYSYTATFKPYYCPCDSLLINIDVTVVSTSGGSKVPPTPPSKITPSGGIHFASVHFNSNLAIPEIQSRVPANPYNNQLRLDTVKHSGGGSGTRTVKVAIIDTGIDSIFSKMINLRPFLTQKTPGALFNFLPYADVSNNQDDDTVMRHGTFVTAAFLNNWKTSPRSLEIMELKALDSTGNGTSFSASCAISYAIQQKVDLINASWGYYGEVDSILLHYIGLCNERSIPVIVAAGNTPGAHKAADVASTGPLNYPNKAGKLMERSAASPANLFFPACFSQGMPYIVSVTGLNNQSKPRGLPCLYQNYSPDFVSIGVTETVSSCAFVFGSTAVEGSSFEAPVITFRVAQSLSGWTAPKPVHALDYLAPLSTDMKLATYTHNGVLIPN